MKIALSLGMSEEEAQFVSQLGVRHVVWGVPDSPTGYLELNTLLRAQEFLEAYGLQLGAIENVPFHFYDKVMFGLPGRDRQIENYCITLSNMGRAGVPVMGYHWMLLGGLSTDSVRGVEGPWSDGLTWKLPCARPPLFSPGGGPVSPIES
jgi:D-mannonate dehydratase